MASCTKRLRRELQALRKEPDPSILLVPDPDNIRLWDAFIQGPPGTAYADKVFQLKINVGADYPLSSPVVSFVTKIFHPNVHFATGEICLDILKKEWSPIWSLQSACRAIIALLSDPEADSPLNCDAGNMIRAGDMRAYNSMVRMYCAEYALDRFPEVEL